jgi:hypothetical protein
MAQTVNLTDFDLQTSWVDAEVEVSRATYEAYKVLYYAFTALAAIAAFDKFLHLLSNWDEFVSPRLAGMFNMSAGAVVAIAGILELLVAAAVALKPRYGSWAITIWLWLVSVNLIGVQGHNEMLLVTLALSAAGYAFTRLAAECN